MRVLGKCATCGKPCRDSMSACDRCHRKLKVGEYTEPSPAHIKEWQKLRRLPPRGTQDALNGYQALCNAAEKLDAPPHMVAEWRERIAALTAQVEEAGA